jgi:CubicO group peptidase (beta-lactamase class C family)
VDVTRPDLSSWLDPQYNRWSLRNARELLPTGAVAPASRPRPLTAVHQLDLLDMAVDTSYGTETLLGFLERSRSDSLTVVQGDNLLLEWRTSGFAEGEVHLIFSVTKSVTAMLAGALVRTAGLDVDAPVTRYVPEVAGSAFGDAVVRNLLDMTVAMRFVEDYTPGPDVRDYRYAVGWYPAPWDAPRLHEFLRTREKDGDHGQRFRYLSPATDMLGWVCEVVAGQPYHRALSELIWQPMGAEHEANMTLDRDGSPRAAGGLSALPRDMARFGMLIRDGGLGAIDDGFLDDVYRGGSHEQWAIGDFKDMFANGVYRSCCYRPGADPDVVMGVGIYGQMLYIDRPRNVVVAKQSSWEQPDESVDHDDAYRVCQAIARELA